MDDDEVTQEPEPSTESDPRQAKAAVDAPGDATTVDPDAAKTGHVTPKPHVRE
jgi:hypothetical protein